MMILVIGGSGSGKSAYAEETAVEISGEREFRRYYLATMQVCDEEGHKRAARHREKRQGKGFLTIEQPVDISRALEKMEARERIALLECMSNLAANEMFAGGIPRSQGPVVEKIIRETEILKKELTHLVVVSNNVFEDGIAYDDSTMEYIRAMGAVNRRLAAMADQVVEVVTGIPVVIK